MIKKGTALPIKKAIGIVVGLVGLGFLGIESLETLVINNQLFFGIVLLFASYFLLISGRQL